MQVFINNQQQNIASNTLDMLITELSLHNQRIAVEINQEIVPKSEYQHWQLCENDNIEIIKAVGGG